MSKQKQIIGLQALIRGYLIRLKFKKQLETRAINAKQKGYERIVQRIKTIQSHWRGREIRKVYKELKLDRHTKAMQIGYFNQQIELLGNEAFMCAMKTNYQINKNESRSINTNNNNSNNTHSNNRVPYKNLVTIETSINSKKNTDSILKSENLYPNCISRGENN